MGCLSMNSYFLEFVILTSLIVVFLKFSKFHKEFVDLSTFKILSIITFFYLMLLGQVLKNSDITYPFTYWGMYSQVTPSTTYYEHIITLSDGTITHYPYELIVFTSQRAFMRKIENIERSTRNDEERIQLNHAINSLINIYENKYQNHQIIEFKLNEVRVIEFKGSQENRLSKSNRYHKVITI
jgi:hypothetical protein